MDYRAVGDDSKKSGDPIPLVQFRAEFQFAFGELMELPRPQLWDDITPATDSDLRNAESGSSSDAGPEILNYVFFEHPSMLAMLYEESKNDLPAAGYAGPMETMGDRIRLLRQAKSLTQEQLGGRIGVSKVAVSQWETGSTSNIRLKTFLTLCEELGTTPHYLIFGPDRPGATKRRSGQ